MLKTGTFDQYLILSSIRSLIDCLQQSKLATQTSSDALAADNLQEDGYTNNAVQVLHPLVLKCVRDSNPKVYICLPFCPQAEGCFSVRYRQSHGLSRYECLRWCFSKFYSSKDSSIPFKYVRNETSKTRNHRHNG